MNSLSVSSVSKVFKSSGKSITAIDDVSFDVKAGNILALLGENGAGKSSLIRICTGLMTPDRGSVLIAGKYLKNSHALKKVGLLLEGNRNLYWRLTPLENMEYYGGLKGITKREAKERGTSLLKKFNLFDKANSPIQNLSRGMQQKISIICSLINRPDILFLDEPTLGLDQESSDAILNIVDESASEGCSVVITSHQIELIESISSDVAILKKGKIICTGKLNTLLDNNQGLFEIYYELPIKEEDRQKLLTFVPGIAIEQNRVVFNKASATLQEIINLTSHLSVISVNPVINTLNQLFHKTLLTRME